MTSVLSYSMSASDPFAPPSARKSIDDPTARYPSPLAPAVAASQHSRPSTASTTRASVSSSRPGTSRTSAYQTIIDEFGSCLPQQGHSSASTTSAAAGAARSSYQHHQHRATLAPSMPLPLPEATASMSTAQASSHSHSAQAATAAATASAQARKRQSHNPSALVQASPPKAEYLSDEYVLHPSVHAFKQAHPTRPMIALGHYILLQTLGEGEFGKVKLGVHSDYGVEVAIKLIRRGTLEDEQRANKVEREIEVLRQLKHPNIVRMLDVIDTAKYIGIVLEFAGGGELFDYILANRYLKEKDASRLFAQLISGVDYLHQKHIVHRDLKLENLLLDKHRNIIITDFGFANRFERDEDDLMSTSCGSPCYAAPELVVTEGLYVGTAVDVWSCGVILYAMLSGYLPYDDDPANPDGDNINLLYKYIMSTPLNFPDHMSEIAKHLLLVMLVPNPQDRGTIAMIEEHPWLEPHHALFERSVNEHELIFADNMIRKSQQAKRDLATRRRLQQEAKLVKALQRSQSSSAGMALSSADQQRRVKDQRHRSALPGTITVPEHLNNAGLYPPGPEPSVHARPPEMERNATLPVVSTTEPPSGLQTPTRNNSVKRPSDSAELDTPTPRSKAPMSANKNRHTIQVEYDGDMSWEQVRPDLGNANGKDDARDTPSPATPPRNNLNVPQAGDTEIESASDMEAPEKPEKREVPASEPPKEVVPIASSPTTAVTVPSRPPTPPLPSTPTKSASRTREEPEGTTEPTVSTPISTPKSAASRLPQTDQTPRARASYRSHRASLPPGAATPQQQVSSTLPDSPLLPPSRGPSVAAKRASRTRKGMSLDKFGLAKLLGQSNPSDVSLPRSSYIPVSKHSKTQSMYQPTGTQGSVSQSPGTDPKKTRRKTLNLLSSRTATPDGASTTSSIAPPVVVGPQGIIRPHDQLSQGAPSIVTVDRDESARPATTSTAKRVMDWFRRKSAKDSLSTIHAGIRTESGSISNVGTDRTVQATSRPRISMDHAAVSETSSVAQTVDTSPIIVIEEEPAPETPKEKTSVKVKTGPEFTRQPLAPASSKANVEAQPTVDTGKLSTPERSGIPTRSKSQRVTPSKSGASPIPPSSPLSPTSPIPRGDEGKLRLHTGLVDQSALSSQSPQEIMAEARRVLQTMGIEIKEEAEFRFRCTRVRRRKAGPTTGLSTGPFARMAAMGSSTSVHKSSGADGRSPSVAHAGGIAGLKDMLLRRGSSYSGHHGSIPRSDSDILAHSTTTEGGEVSPLYGEHSIDNGDEVKFVVELCRIKNLNGLYLLSIKRLRGSVWSFKFIYQTIVDRCETLTH